MPRNPNPQGKGVVPVLQTLGQHRLLDFVPPKKIDQVQMELFTSLFVLQSDIRFNPVIGRSYWLYQVDGNYRLSMVAPEEWLRPWRGRFIGECVLQKDRTWTLSLCNAMNHDVAFMKMIEDRRRAFDESMEAAENVESMLPEYDSNFSFYARVLAYTLGKSLDISMQLSGIKGLTYAQAKGLLSHEK